MILLDTKIAEYIELDSTIEIDSELYEWSLGGFGRKGEQIAWMFLDWKIKTAVETSPVNVKDLEEIRSLITDETRIISLTAEDLTKEELKMLQDMAVSKFAFRVFRRDSKNFTPGGFERVAILGSSFEYKNSNQRFNYTIKVQRRSLPLAR